MTIAYGCEGLKAVISGGTSGIGFAAAEKLAADGAEVYILGRDREKGFRAAASLTGQTMKQAAFLPCDVRDRAACERALDNIDGKIDILINAAGIYFEQPLEKMTDEDYARMMDVNLKGVMNLTAAALFKMKGGGSIINIASDAALHGNYGCPLYCASKGAVVALTKALALDLAPKIRVNCICPGDTETPMLESQLEKGGYTKEDVIREYPLKKIASAGDIAHVICSVASPENAFMTGSIIAADGGLTAK